MDSVWIWFAENGNIRKWQSTPFQDGVEYRRAPAQAAVQALDELRRKIQAIPRTDRGFSWEQSNSRNIEELRAYGPIAAMCKFILDNTDAILSALVSAPADPAPAPADVVELIDEGLEILNSLIDNIKRKGNYSPESTCVFLDQAGSSFRAARTALSAQGWRTDMENAPEVST